MFKQAGADITGQLQVRPMLYTLYIDINLRVVKMIHTDNKQQITITEVPLIAVPKGYRVERSNIHTETITEVPLIAVPKGYRVERSNILQYDYVCSSTVILVYCRVYSVIQ